MILTNHSLIGVALTHKSIQYSIIFLIALGSHYLFDMIPHWHYRTPSIKEAVNAPFGKRTLRVSSAPYDEIMRIILDLTVGLGLSLYFFSASPMVIVVGVAGAVLPDLLVGFGRFYPIRVLVLHDRFHKWIHARHMLDDWPLIGITSQIIIAAILVFLLR
ncbi:MAG: hypothetical protein AAB482_04120 [Patescibacteria group bacterium]